jgi:large subunit ribosomal protein L2
MALKNFRPLTPTLRFKSLPGFDEITKARPAKRLVAPKKKTGGRNHFGRLTSRHIGGGQQKYRKSISNDASAALARKGSVTDPNRSAGCSIKYRCRAELHSRA